MSYMPGGRGNRLNIRAGDHDARLYAAAEKHRLVKAAAEGDAAYDGSAPKPSLLKRLRRLTARRRDDTD